MRVIVTGSRKWEDAGAVYEELYRVLQEHGPFVLVHGACSTGADYFADLWYRIVGSKVGCAEDPFRADWGLWAARGKPKVAGPERNKRMVRAGAQLMLAFLEPCTQPHCDRPKPHDSHGTADCVALAKDAGIEVRERRP